MIGNWPAEDRLTLTPSQSRVLLTWIPSKKLTVLLLDVGFECFGTFHVETHFLFYDPFDLRGYSSLSLP